jgi:hypothetical protein
VKRNPELDASSARISLAFNPGYVLLCYSSTASRRQVTSIGCAPPRVERRTKRRLNPGKLGPKPETSKDEARGDLLSARSL